MKTSKYFVFGIILALLVLVLYTFTYQVRFDEVAVVTRFGKATDESVVRGDEQAGWKVKLPRPIDSVKKYSNRTQVLDIRAVEAQTRDEIAVIVQTYVAWRIENPLEFYRSVRTVEEAESQLRSKIDSARNNVVAQYTFEQMTSPDPAKLKLQEMEEAILTALRDMIKDQGYGIELKSVGIKRVLLSSKVTEQVFERMKQTRAKKAQEFKSAGESQAKAITSSAESVRDSILTFARQRADEIRSEGENAAADILKTFSEDQELAIFQREIEALQAMFKNSSEGRTTLVLDGNHPLMQILSSSPTKPAAPAPPAE